MKLQQVWVIYEQLEWEFSDLCREHGEDLFTVRKLLLESLRVFRVDVLAEPFARLSLHGEIQPLRKKLVEYNLEVLEFELIFAHTEENFQTRYISPLHEISDPTEEDLSELIYICEDSTLETNPMLVEELTQHASNTQYTPVVGFLGNTGTGKSLLLASLLDRQSQIPSIRKDGQSGSTSANVHIFQKTHNVNVISYLDFEGENGTTPQVLRQAKFWRSRERVDELSRRKAVKKLFPKLAYILCDVVLFCTTDEIHSDYSVYDRCLEFAHRANYLLKETDRPVLIIIHNKFCVSGNADNELDIEQSSQQFLETFDEKNELRGFFSTCKVIRLPLLSDVHDSGILRSLWDRQMDKVIETINEHVLDRNQSRRDYGYQLTQTSWFKILPRIVHDVCNKNQISMAEYLLDLQHSQLEKQRGLGCEIFRCLFESRNCRSLEWYNTCASIAVDTLARVWGVSQYEQGLLVNENTVAESGILQSLLSNLRLMQPCTATITKNKKTYSCEQYRVLHDHHRTVVKTGGIRGKLKKVILGVQQKTVTWEGEFETNEEEIRNIEKKLSEQFKINALAFAQQNHQVIEEILERVFGSDEYQTTIWKLLMTKKFSYHNEPSLEAWAQELTKYCMRSMNVQNSVNLWEKATRDWRYLNSFCRHIPLASIKCSDEILGRGEFGVVYAGAFVDEEDELHNCAIKVIQESSRVFHLDGLRQEIVILSVLSHPRIVHFYGYSYDNQTASFKLVLRKMELNMCQWVEKTRPSLRQLLQLACDIAEGITVLHSFNIAHRDLDPGNILLQHDGYIWRAYISDLGIARKVTEEGMTRLAPKPDFCAPELLLAESWQCFYTLAVDVYSFGKLIEFLMKNESEHDDSISHQLNTLIMQCTHDDPQRRPTMVANYACVVDLMRQLREGNFE